MAQTEEFMFQNVAYRPTVYRTGTIPTYHQQLWGVSARVNNCFELVATHSLTKSSSIRYHNIFDHKRNNQ